jgi:hypothetical protein
MLSRFDDYPIHQTPEPIAHPASTDRHAYDRFWFNGYARDGDLYFGIGAALYPNLGIMDCGFSIVRDGVQHSFHASRRAPKDPAEIRVGPFEITILEPMQSLQVRLDDNASGLACQLTFLPRTANVQEGRQTWKRGRITMDATRFDQFGSWSGEIRCNGEDLAIRPERVCATKDRSWGIRPVGDPDPGGAPALELPQFFFLWSPIQWRDHCTLVGIFEDADGGRWHWDGFKVPAYATAAEIPGVEDPRTESLLDVGWRLDYASGTRWARGGELTLVERSGLRREIRLEPVLRFQMKGIGYGHPEWGHGRWKGDLAIGGESWKLADLDPMSPENLHVQQVVKARCGDEEGVGVLEQICLGPHRPSGFREFLDPAV